MLKCEVVCTLYTAVATAFFSVPAHRSSPLLRPQQQQRRSRLLVGSGTVQRLIRPVRRRRFRDQRVGDNSAERGYYVRGRVAHVGPRSGVACESNSTRPEERDHCALGARCDQLLPSSVVDYHLQHVHQQQSRYCT